MANTDSFIVRYLAVLGTEIPDDMAVAMQRGAAGDAETTRRKSLLCVALSFSASPPRSPRLRVEEEPAPAAALTIPHATDYL